RRARRLAAGCRAHPPFRADTAMAVLRRVCDDTSRPIREINPEIPEWLAALVAKLQAKDPGQRFATATEVAALLSRRLTQLQMGAEEKDEGRRMKDEGRQKDRRQPLRLLSLFILHPSAFILLFAVLG